MWLCHEYLSGVYQPGSPLIRPAKVGSLQRSPLGTGRDHPRAHQRPARRRPRFAQPMLSSHQRPFQPSDRSQAGHREGDLIVGKNQGSVIGTLVERQTLFIRLLHLPRRDADSLHTAIAAGLPPNADPFPYLGSGASRWHVTSTSRPTSARRSTSAIPTHPGSAAATRIAAGYCASTFPKGTDLSCHTAKHLRAVEDDINNRPRAVLEDRSPAELFTALPASPDHQMLRR